MRKEKRKKKMKNKPIVGIAIVDLNDPKFLSTNYQPRIQKLSERSKSIAIRTEADVGQATDFGVSVKQLFREVDEKRKSITDPMRLAMKNTNDMFDRLLIPLNEIEDDIKGKIVSFRQEESRRRAQAEAEAMAKAQAEAERERKRLEEQARKAQEKGNDEKAEMLRDRAESVVATPVFVQPLDKTTKTESGSRATGRKVRDFIIVNENLLPRNFLTPNLTAIRQAVLAGVEIPGVETFEKEIISFASR